MSRPVTQDWVHGISLMQQTVLLTAVRGPDGVEKYHPVKYLIRWFRRCVLLSALDRAVLLAPYVPGGGSFTGTSYGETEVDHDWRPSMDEIVSSYLRALDGLPHHFHMHLLHAAEILGFKHPDEMIRNWWRGVYERLVRDLHLNPETEEQLDERLGDDRDAWLSHNDAATVS